MEPVTCYCLKCKVKLGSCINAWHGIGNTYFSPLYSCPALVNGLVATGDLHEGAQGSQVENSFLKDLACKKCKTLLGLRCEGAPDGHLLKRDQLLLRLAYMSLRSENTGGIARPNVLETFPLILTGTKSPPTARRAATVQPSLAQTHKPRDEIKRRQPALPSENTNLLSVLEEKSQNDLTIFQTWVKDTVRNQQGKVDRLQGTVQRLERDMISFKGLMNDIRSELATNREPRETGNDTSLYLVNDEVSSLRTQIKENEEKTRSALGDAKTAIAKIGQQASEAASAKEDLKNVKTYLQRLVDSPTLQKTSKEMESLKEDLRNMQSSIQKLIIVTTNFPPIRQKANEIDGIKDDLRALKNGAKELDHVLKATPDMARMEKDLTAIKLSLQLLNERIDGEVTVREGCVASLKSKLAAASAAPERYTSRIEDRKQVSVFVDLTEPEENHRAPGPGTSPTNHGFEAKSRAATARENAIASSVSTSKSAKWRYTGPDTRQAIWSACSALGLSTKRRNNNECIKTLEDHVHKTSQQNTPQARKHGEIVSLEDSKGPNSKLILPSKRSQDNQEDVGQHSSRNDDIVVHSNKRKRVSTRSANDSSPASRSGARSSQTRNRGRKSRLRYLESSPILGDDENFTLYQS